jgi:K+-sensing histidine kinase KdpD
VTQIQLLQEEQKKVSMLKFLQASVSHDMMAPIQNITIFFGQLFRMGLEGNILQMHRYHQLCLDSTQLLSCRVKDLLDRNLIENGTFSVREVELSHFETVKQILSIYQTMMKDLNVKFEMVYSP